MNKKQLFTLLTLIALAIGALLIKKNSRKIVKDTVFDPPVKTETKKETQAEEDLRDLPLNLPKPHKATAKEREKFKRLTLEEFRAYAQESLKIMPKSADVRKLPPNQVHHVPPPVIEAGRRLGKIREMLVDRPDLVEEAQKFYLMCAGDSGNMTSVRALCLTHIIRLKQKRNEDLDLSVYPKKVVELAKMAVEL